MGGVVGIGGSGGGGGGVAVIFQRLLVMGWVSRAPRVVEEFEISDGG